MAKEKKEKPSPIEKLQKKCRLLQGCCLLLALLLAAAVYNGYDYWAFKLLIGGNYIYTDTLDELYAEHLGLPKGELQGYSKHFDQMVMAVVTRAIRAKNDDRYTYLYTPTQYTSSKKAEKEDAKLAAVTPLTDNTVCINILNFSDGTKDFFMDNKEELAKYKNLVIDLRYNYGGFLWDFYAMAELFLPKDTVLGYENTRQPLFSRTVKTKKDAYFYFDHIIILQNDQTASAAEGFILALSENMDNVTLVGETTFGKGIGQVTVPLKDGYAVKGTVLSLEGPKGESIHRKGIEPDVAYSGEEDMLDFILTLLP